MTIYLYIKQHSITKLRYFGFTKQKSPTTYKGSGKYWKSHCKIHGWEYVETIKIFIFEDQKEATSFALMFSEYYDIVNSKVWANLIPEDAISKGPDVTGRKHTQE